MQLDEIGRKALALARSHPLPNEGKLENRIMRLERMANFYQAKIAEVPERQAIMFNGFVSALTYALTTIKMYRKLTRRLAELAEEAKKSDERPNQNTD